MRRPGLFALVLILLLLLVAAAVVLPIVFLIILVPTPVPLPPASSSFVLGASGAGMGGSVAQSSSGVLAAAYSEGSSFKLVCLSILRYSSLFFHALL